MSEQPGPTQATPTPLPRGRLLFATGATLILAVLIVLGVVLPAEFDRDPLGTGRLSGLSRLWAPDDVKIDVGKADAARAREYATPFRTDVIEIPLGGFLDGVERSELEYKGEDGEGRHPHLRVGGGGRGRRP